MKRELALQLIRSILPDPPWNEVDLQDFFKDLEVLAEHKYNSYEMYHPGRLFFENLYLWLSGFETEARTAALHFVRENLIFISRREFQQLAQVLHSDKIYQRQLDIVAENTGIPRIRVRMLTQSEECQRIRRSSLYVALSDGARIDYFRRQHLDISNEQVLPIYYPSEDKRNNLIAELEKSLGNGARFECLFLIDDFCGSGRTMLREEVTLRLPKAIERLDIPMAMRACISYDEARQELKLAYSGQLNSEAETEIQGLCEEGVYQDGVRNLIDRYRAGEGKLVGSLTRMVTDVRDLITPSTHIFLCPLLTTQYAIERLKPLIPRLDSPFDRLEILPGAILPDSIRINPPPAAGVSDMNIGTLCEDYYREELGDEHTGSIKYGYDHCGLPLVLHHNTPNNSIYLLWVRKLPNPLFVRYERHGREEL